MKVEFRTNLDLIPADKHGWPTELPFRPHVGDHIQSCHEHPKNKLFRLTLQVMRVTVVTKTDPRPGYHDDKPEFSHLEVELHLPDHFWENLSGFYRFYENLTGHKFI